LWVLFTVWHHHDRFTNLGWIFVCWWKCGKSKSNNLTSLFQEHNAQCLCVMLAVL
jgi:hypothetical protein